MNTATLPETEDTTLHIDDLSRQQVNVLVALIEHEHDGEVAPLSWYRFDYCTDPDKAHTIIEREGISLTCRPASIAGRWLAAKGTSDVYGRTAIETAMRCWVAHKYGKRVNYAAMMAYATGL